MRNAGRAAPKNGPMNNELELPCCDVTEGFSNRSLRTTLLQVALGVLGVLPCLGYRDYDCPPPVRWYLVFQAGLVDQLEQSVLGGGVQVLEMFRTHSVRTWDLLRLHLLQLSLELPS